MSLACRLSYAKSLQVFFAPYRTGEIQNCRFLEWPVRVIVRDKILVQLFKGDPIFSWKKSRGGIRSMLERWMKLLNSTCHGTTLTFTEANQTESESKLLLHRQSTKKPMHRFGRTLLRNGSRVDKEGSVKSYTGSKLFAAAYDK